VNRVLWWIGLAVMLCLTIPAATLMLLTCNRDYFRELSDELRHLLTGDESCK
jgi:hypothetical protein